MKVKLTLTIFITILATLTACNLKSQPPSIDQFITEGYEFLRSETGDLNLDKYPDMILILNKLEVEEESSGVRSLNILIGQKNNSYKLVASNENVVMGGQAGGAMGEPLQGVTIEKGSFSVEHTYGSRELTNTVVTFKYSSEDNNWFLHETSERMTDRHDPDNYNTEIMNTKDFGKIPFDKYEGFWSLYGIKQQMSGEQTWFLANDIIGALSGGTLTISGAGALIGEGEYSEGEGYFPYVYPWSEYSGEITNVVIENGITEIGDLAFQSKQLTSVTIPNSVIKIGDSAFAENHLAEVTLPNSVTVIKVSAFYGNPLTSISIGANVYIGFADDDGQPDAAFSEAFVNYYNSGGKKAGTYTLNNGVWSLAGGVATKGYKSGDIGPAGGIIFYDKGQLTDGWRYLEAAPEAYEFTALWGFEGTEVAGTGTGIGSGKRNTDIMVQLLSAMLDGRISLGKKNTEGAGSNRELTNNAAYKCSKLEINGFKDWFLPSKDELNLMYSTLHSKNLGAFKDNYYWSSSVWYEENNHLFNSQYNTWIQTFSGGYHDHIGYEGAERENQELLVRAVRAF